MNGLSVPEAVRVSESFLITLYTDEVYKRWTELKYKLKFDTEQQFVTWIMDWIERQHLVEAESHNSYNKTSDGMDGNASLTSSLDAKIESKEVDQNSSSTHKHTVNKHYGPESADLKGVQSKHGKGRLKLVPVVNKDEVCSYFNPKSKKYEVGAGQVAKKASTKVGNNQSIGMRQIEDCASSSVSDMTDGEEEEDLIMVDKEDLKKLYQVETTSNAETSGGSSSPLPEASDDMDMSNPDDQPVIVDLTPSRPGTSKVFEKSTLLHRSNTSQKYFPSAAVMSGASTLRDRLSKPVFQQQQGIMQTSQGYMFYPVPAQPTFGSQQLLSTRKVVPQDVIQPPLPMGAMNLLITPLSQPRTPLANSMGTQGVGSVGSNMHTLSETGLRRHEVPDQEEMGLPQVIEYDQTKSTSQSDQYFICQYCAMSFKHSNALNSHIYKRHGC